MSAITSTFVITPLVWLELAVLGPERLGVKYNRPYNLNTSNFETVELRDDWAGRRIETCLNNTFHSKVRPAIARASGDQEWWVNGEMHRDTDKPARVWADGSQWWFKNGNLYRDPLNGIDQPTIVIYDGSLQWWVNWRLHRGSIDGVEQPAYVDVDEGVYSLTWSVKGKQRRNPIDGVHKPTWVGR